jgi:hypothetical protein
MEVVLGCRQVLSKEKEEGQKGWQEEEEVTLI